MGKEMHNLASGKLDFSKTCSHKNRPHPTDGKARQTHAKKECLSHAKTKSYAKTSAIIGGAGKLITSEKITLFLSIS